MVGSRLIYGYRKAFMQANETARTEYGCGSAMYKISARNTIRMEAM